MPKKKLALKLGIQTYQILTNDGEFCIPSLSSILLAVLKETTCMSVNYCLVLLQVPKDFGLVVLV